MKTGWKDLRYRIWQARFLYLLLIPGLAYFIIFHYVPMGGLVLAFKKFNARLGIWGSPWVGLTNFRRIFSTQDAVNAIRNTFAINLSRLVFQFPAPILLALLINEMRGVRLKRVYQTIYTFPHFLSWIIVSTLLNNFFANGGMVNSIISALITISIHQLLRWERLTYRSALNIPVMPSTSSISPNTMPMPRTIFSSSSTAMPPSATTSAQVR